MPASAAWSSGDGAGRSAGGTADHGNCETMLDPRPGTPTPPHTLNPVPVALVGVDGVSLADGRLADVAPTLST